ncbi:MAG: V-type ATPase subunit [Synergistales bacterium]|nr:V-type ATPase subunit [Synergistales bacterium]
MNAILRGRSSGFLDDSAFRRFSGFGLRQFEVSLLESRYGEAFRTELVSREASSLRRIELALALGTADTFQLIRRIADGEPRQLLDVLFARADIHNLRLLLRTFSVPRSGQREAPLWMQYGLVSEEVCRDLWKSDDQVELEERCRGLGTPLTDALGDAVRELLRHRTLVQAERRLLRGILAFLLQRVEAYPSRNGELVAGYLGRLVDLWNTGIWLRAVTSGEELTEERFLPGGESLPPERLRRFDDVQSLIAGTAWNKVRTDDNPPAPVFQRRMQVAFWRWQITCFRGDPLGIDVLIGFVARQLVEWQNLSTIAVGIVMGHTEEQIRALLVPVGRNPGNA